jgi:hypothetical protein
MMGSRVAHLLNLRCSRVLLTFQESTKYRCRFDMFLLHIQEVRYSILDPDTFKRYTNLQSITVDLLMPLLYMQEVSEPILVSEAFDPPSDFSRFSLVLIGKFWDSRI